MNLTSQQIRFFRDTGYLKLPRVASDDEVSEMLSVIDSHFERRIEPYRTRTGLAGDPVTLYGTVQRAPIFLRVIQSPPMAGALRSLLGPNVELKLNRHNHARINPPGHNKFYLHRDILQWSRGQLTVIIYLEDTNIENGCTHVVPTTHFLPSAGVPENGITCMDDYEIYHDLREQAVPVPMRAGGALILDSFVFHTPGTNVTAGSRKSLCFAFHSSDELSSRSDNDDSQIVLGERIYLGNNRLPADAYLKYAEKK
ncbi:MAG: phytanoyl-CoA dioxygenase family protein [Byssovorax sp.]